MPNFFTIVDRASQLLVPEAGIISVVDFYTSARPPQLLSEVSGIKRECNWFSRWFWQIWFDFDGVNLGPDRRNYLEYRFSTVSNYFLRLKVCIKQSI